MIKQIQKNKNRQARHMRIRKNISGTPDVPRLNVFRSNTGMYVQVIDDVGRVTLASASTAKLGLKTNNVAACAQLGTAIGDACVKAGIKKVVFDRGGYLYHGKVKALAESARTAGLEF